ncbi:MAG: DUF3084 domain-containing protein [Firmicutes bacterium]|jgi:uncharacterized protein (DUF3084 family)|nr:DUF3084 domain-containing protein [Bacillota bacterium]
MYGVTLIAVLGLVGGIIAYIGDRIGMKVGRSRLSLFGLRPKHTSVIVTICTGVIIAGASIAALTIASQDVRTALFHMKEIKEALANSEALYQSTKAQLDEVELQLIEQEKQAAELTVQIQEKTRMYADLDEQLQTVVLQRDAAQQELNDARSALEGITERYEATKLQYDQALSDLERAKSELNTTRTQLQEAVTQLAREEQRYDNMKQINERLDARIRELQETEERMREQMAVLSEEYESYIRRQEGIIMEATRRLQEIQQGDFAFQSGEILLATIIDGGMSQDQVRSELLTFLRQVDRLALERGASIEGRSSAVKVQSEEHFNQVVEALALQSEKFVVRAVSISNTLVGDPVIVRLVHFPNQLIYRKGDVVSSTVVTTKLPAEIEAALLELLQDVSAAGIEQGMITKADGSVGDVSVDDFLNAMAEVRRLRGPVVVNAVADINIWTAIGPLKVRLTVEPAPDEPAE